MDLWRLARGEYRSFPIVVYPTVIVYYNFITVCFGLSRSSASVPLGCGSVLGWSRQGGIGSVLES